MRRALVLAVLALALATTALAQGKTRVPSPSGGLRGPLGVEAAQPAPEPIVAPAPALRSPVPTRQATGGQCRLACAQDYYFCLSTEAADDCPGAWSQCRAACDAGLKASKTPAG